jgi:hypothetical protein
VERDDNLLIGCGDVKKKSLWKKEKSGKNMRECVFLAFVGQSTNQPIIA